MGASQVRASLLVKGVWAAAAGLALRPLPRHAGRVPLETLSYSSWMLRALCPPGPRADWTPFGGWLSSGLPQLGSQREDLGPFHPEPHTRLMKHCNRAGMFSRKKGGDRLHLSPEHVYF